MNDGIDWIHGSYAEMNVSMEDLIWWQRIDMLLGVLQELAFVHPIVHM
jgi:hypothetical protein